MRKLEVHRGANRVRDLHAELCRTFCINLAPEFRTQGHFDLEVTVPHLHIRGDGDSNEFKVDFGDLPTPAFPFTIVRNGRDKRKVLGGEVGNDDPRWRRGIQ